MPQQHERPLSALKFLYPDSEPHTVLVTSDAGLLACRELDEPFGLTARINSELTNNRAGKNTRQGLLALPGQLVYSRPTGYEDTNNAERLSVGHAIM